MEARCAPQWFRSRDHLSLECSVTIPSGTYYPADAVLLRVGGLSGGLREIRDEPTSPFATTERGGRHVEAVGFRVVFRTSARPVAAREEKSTVNCLVIDFSIRE